MQKNKPARKPDFMFIIVSLCAIALIVVGSLFIKREEPVIDPADLPVDENNNIHELVISEIMSNNSGVYLNSNNEASDYLELYNGTSKTINLHGYGLSDNETTVKWLFPDIKIQPGEYLAIGLTGRIEEGNNASFRLSSQGGEKVILVNASSKVIDAVETISLKKNQAMMRDGNGQWFVSGYGTPGYPNTEKGLDSYYASLWADEEENVIQINELLLKNKGNYLDKTGTYSGYLEVVNTSDKPVDLGEYALSDSQGIPFRYSFGSRVLNSGELVCISFADLGFDFNGPKGNIILSHNGKIVEDVEYSNMVNGKALIRDEKGNYYYSGVISPGYPNTADGVESFQKEYLSNPDGLMINEVMTKNDSYMAQNGNQYYDWIELKNNSSAPINLSEYFISKSYKNLDGYQLPDVTLQPGEFFMLMCSGETALSNNSYYHTSFKLSDDDSLFLSKGNTIIDCMYIPEVPYGYSYGRNSTNGFFFMETPSPKSDNNSGYRTMLYKPQFSVVPGVYDDVDNVSVEIRGSGVIRYTLDGSEPTSSSAVYSSPLNLTSTTVVKAKSYGEQSLTSDMGVASYVINEHHTVPVMSVSLDPYDFRYLNNNAWEEGIEVQAYAELFEEDGSFSIPCSLALFGGNARSMAKKCYALRFDEEWGAENLHYQVFDNRDNSIYKALVLRNGSTDWSEAYMRDILGTSLVDDYTDVAVQAYKICIVYINGEYWGLYNIREKVNKHFISENCNVDPSTVNIARLDYDVTAGSYSGYGDLRNFAVTHSLAYDENYEYMASRMNMVDVCDYWIAEAYTTNNDIVNCRFYQSDDYDDGRWHYIFYDLDYAFYNDWMNYYTEYLYNPAGMGWPDTFENDIIYNLLKNDEFCELFLERLSYNFKNTWNPDIVMGRLEEIYNKLAPEMDRNLEEWGLSKSYYESAVEDLRNYIRRRPDYMLSQTKSFFGLSDARMKELFGDLW